MENGNAALGSGADDGHHSPNGKALSSGGSSSHVRQKRSLSGTFMSRISFLRNRSDNNTTNVEDPQINNSSPDRHAPLRSAGAMATVLQESKGRKRKGSLRKRALLGTGKSKLEGRERSNSISNPQRRSLGFQKQMPAMDDTGLVSKEHEPTESNIQQLQDFSHERLGGPYSVHNGFPLVDAQIPQSNHIGNETWLEAPLNQTIASELEESLASNATPDNEDEPLAFGIKRTVDLLSPPLSEPHSSSGSDSYFPALSTGVTRSRSNRLKSPLVAYAVESAPADEEWDYSETEWWGWVILIATWIVFVVGMGSCLGVWSWAWDVGETPYAPPELEDDPTLPIVGYYPALMILTCVMAWVWVFVAWMGLKYFKHAKIQGEDI